MDETEYQEAFEHLLSVMLALSEELHSVEDLYSFASEKVDALLEIIDEALDKYDH